MNSQPSEKSRWLMEEVCPHEPALRAYLRSSFPTLTDLDDLVQETYARLLRAKSAGKVDHARSYLFATARNAALDLFRRGRIVSIVGIADVERLGVLEDGPSAAETVNHDQELEILAEAIRALPERCRQVLVLRKISGLSHRAIAEKLGISENTVNAQVTIGVIRCREFLRARGVIKGGKLEYR